MKLQTYIDRYEDSLADYQKYAGQTEYENLVRWERLLNKKKQSCAEHTLSKQHNMGPSPKIFYCKLVMKKDDLDSIMNSQEPCPVDVDGWAYIR